MTNEPMPTAEARQYVRGMATNADRGLVELTDTQRAAVALGVEVERLRARDKAATAAGREARRLLDDWQTAEELGTVEEWAAQISETLAPLASDDNRS